MLKLTWRKGPKDTFVGFLMPRNNKIKPNRGLSGEHAARSGAGAGQQDLDQEDRMAADLVEPAVLGHSRGRVLRGVADVDEGGSRGEAAHRDSASGLVSGAGWNAFSLDYGKPQTLGTLTYFLPTPSGSHDIKVGYEYIFNHYRRPSTASRARFSTCPATVRPIRSSSRTSGRSRSRQRLGSPGTTTTRCSRSLRRTGGHRPRSLTLTFGARFGHQRPHYEQGTRNPILADVFRR